MRRQRRVARRSGAYQNGWMLDVVGERRLNWSKSGYAANKSAMEGNGIECEG